MTNTKLLDLLREARESLQGVAEYDTDPDKSWTFTKEACRDALVHIDAALAVHDAVPEWSDMEWLDGAFRGYTVAIGPLTLSTFPIDGKWLASVAYTMPFDTLDEAKSAAIAAARGMK
jgi:hypothetical protein